MPIIEDYASDLDLRCALTHAYDHSVVHAVANRWGHIDPDYACWYLRSGEVRIKSTAFTSCVGSGKWLFLEPLYPRTQVFSDEAEIISIRMQCAQHGLQSMGKPQCPFVVDTSYHDRLFGHAIDLLDALRRMDARLEDPVDYHQLKACFHTWLGCWFQVRAEHGRSIQTTPEHEPRLLRMLTILESKGFTGPAPYAALERELHLSRSQINRIFHANLGLTPQQWRERQLQDQVEQLLKCPDMSIKQVTHQLGFVDNSHFSKWFKKRYGLAPSVYRANGYRAGV